jgi:hypothetical protein
MTIAIWESQVSRGDEWNVTCPIRPNDAFDNFSDKLQIWFCDELRPRYGELHVMHAQLACSR